MELVANAWRELQYGCTRTQIWLFRAHGRRVAQCTIQRIFRDLGLPRLRRTKKRAPKPLMLFEKPRPGDSVQVDTKVVRIGGEKAYQYTALDDCTRLRVLRLYQRLHVRSSLLVLSELTRAFPFPIRTLQCDTALALRGWEHTYNHERFSMALGGRTPADKLTALSSVRRAA